MKLLAGTYRKEISDVVLFANNSLIFFKRFFLFRQIVSVMRNNW